MIRRKQLDFNIADISQNSNRSVNVLYLVSISFLNMSIKFKVLVFFSTRLVLHCLNQTILKNKKIAKNSIFNVSIIAVLTNKICKLSNLFFERTPYRGQWVPVGVHNPSKVWSWVLVYWETAILKTIFTIIIGASKKIYSI